MSSADGAPVLPNVTCLLFVVLPEKGSVDAENEYDEYGKPSGPSVTPVVAVLVVEDTPPLVPYRAPPTEVW